MSFEFKLPDIGEGVVEGEIVKWLVNPGDAIREDDPVVEVMTDKATVELTSPRTGTIQEIHAAEGETIAVGSILVTIDADGAAPEPKKEVASPAPTPPVAEAPPPSPAPAPAAEPAPAPVAIEPEPARASGTVAPAMPGVRRLAREIGVDINRVRGTGPGGRILEADVKAAAAGGMGSASRPAPIVRADERVPFRGLRRKIAEKMTESKHSAAHFTYVDEADCSRLVQVRKAAKEKAAARGVKLTFLPFIAKAVAKAIEAHPVLNSSLDETAGEIVMHGRVHVGIAADTDKGLIVPVVKDVQSRSIFEIATEIARLAEDARVGKSKLEDLTGSTFTITSVGSLGGMFATPIINYPEVAILGVNRIEERPVVVDGQITIRHMTYFSISLDHRIVDGAEGARFMNTFKSYIEEPALLFLDAME